MIAPLIVVIVFLALMIFSIIKDYKIKLMKTQIPLYCIMCLIGAIICLLCGFAGSIENISSIFFNTSNINPLKILILFLSCTSISILLDKIGFFSYVAGIVLTKSKSSQTKLFFSFSTIIAVLTIFTSNDILILTFTPFICYFSKHAKINPTPYILSEFVCANVWSMFFIIGNPTNIYLCSNFNITFFNYFLKMVFPTIICGFFATLLVFLIFKKQLKKPITIDEIEIKKPDKSLLIIGLLGLVFMVILMSISNYIGVEMWYIPLICSLLTYFASITCLLIKRQKLDVIFESIKNLPYTLIPFLLSMAVFVAVLENNGFTALFANFLESQNLFIVGLVSFLAGNILNNIPMTMLFTSSLSIMSKNINVIYAIVASSNICALLSPIGSLAGIMFIKILNENKINYNFKTFIKYGIIVSLPTMLIALFIIFLI